MSQNYSCLFCHNTFEITDEDVKFYEKSGLTVGGKQYAMGLPRACPDCRQRRRLAFRNERNLYNRNCDLCKKSIITIYAPDKQLTVYCRDCWWSDKWDPLTYGRDIDFSRSFFDQYQELARAVPKAAIISYNCENCDYTNFQNDSRNCYLTFGSGFMEDCFHCNWCYHAKNIVDCSFCTKGELDYMNVDCFETYHCEYCQDCKQTTDCSHCYDCRSSQNCFGCVGLRKARFYIFNVAYPQAEYEKRLQELRKPENRAYVSQEIEKLKAAYPHRASRITNSEDCTGDDIENSKNTTSSFGVKDCFDVKYTFDTLVSRDGYDMNCTGDTELTHEIIGGGNYKYSHFIFGSAHLNEACYAIESVYSNNIFGCASVKNKKFVILNKQYTQEQYELLVPQLIAHMRAPASADEAKRTGEWGEFFPGSCSPFGYNETLANEYFPLSKEEALAKGFNWSDYAVPFPAVSKVYKASELPKDIKTVTDDILTTAIECEVSGRPFKIVKGELNFYRNNDIPLPTKHPNERYRERSRLRNPRKLFDRPCAKCGKVVKSVYAPDQQRTNESAPWVQTIYCEACYLATMY